MMMKIWIRLATAACAMSFLAMTGCDNSDSGGGISKGHIIASIGPEETCGTRLCGRVSVAVDTKNQPHGIADLGTDNQLFAYHKINGAWSEALFAQGIPHGKYAASRIYLPHLEIDAENRGWVSCKMGVKNWGWMHGEGLWLYENMTTAPTEKWFQYLNLHKGNANVSIDPARPGECVMMAGDALWARINTDGQILERGQMSLGETGEKVRFLISPSPGGGFGVWHAAMGGWREQNGSYMNSAIPAPVTWSQYSKYNEQGLDFVHLSLGIDLVRPEACYIGADYDVGIVINVWNGTSMLYPANDMPVLDAAGDAGINRWGPQMTPTGDGGTLVCWTRANNIMMRYVNASGVIEPPLNAKPLVICSGSKASMCTDSNGDVHMMYDNGGMRYRKIIMQ